LLQADEVHDSMKIGPETASDGTVNWIVLSL